MGSLALLSLLSLATLPAPLTLDEALGLAVKRNAELEVARSDQDAAAADARGSYQGVLPRLDLSGGFGFQAVGPQLQQNLVPVAAYYNNGSTTCLPVPLGASCVANDFKYDLMGVENPGALYGSFQLGLLFNWTIFDGLSSWNAIASSRAKESAANKQYDESALRVAFEVTRRFYEVVKQQRALQVRREAAALSAELVQRADALFPAGRGTKADTYNARVNLGNDQIAVQSQAAALVRARADLAVVLGLASDAGLEVVPPAPVSGNSLPALEDPPPLPDLLSKALKARPLLAAEKFSAQAAELEVSRAQGAYWPIVGLQASYTKQTPEPFTASGLFGDPGKQYTAVGLVTLSWNLYAGGATRAGVERAEAQARRARALQEQAQQTISSEVTSTREQVVALAASVSTAQEILDAADKGLRFARDKLEAGVASQLEVRDATLKLAQAKLTLVSTVVDLVVARADLNRAVGGSL